MKKLEGKTAIITGGGNGIGKATAKKFLEEGASVAIWDIDEQAGSAAITELSKLGPVRFYKVNTVDPASVEAAANATHADFGAIHILINNAGITRDSSLKKMTMAQWQQVLDVNLTGVFNCTKSVAPFLAEQAGGRIINAASVVAHYGNFGQANYVATKAGVIGMTKTWARELGRKGVTVNAIAPGFINTEMLATVPEENLNSLRAQTPLGRLGEAGDIANAYAFLASDEAAFITGTVLNVDGGLVI
jgi:3-oxoacyl-[acyl-carrier protein] reductase